MAKKKKAPARKRKKTSRKKKKNTSLFRFALKWGFVLGLWACIFVGALIAWYAAELPDITKSATFDRQTSITVKAADGSVIARYGDLMGESVKVEDLPPHLVHAVLAIEDRRFYDHFGIDLIGFSRAVFVNVSKGRFVQGGSTITQQLAKNLFLSQERTIKRKIQEALLALWLERELSKDEILSAYLNRVYLGSGSYGVDAATKLYFDKPVSDINMREAATIAGLLKAPSRYSPLRNPELSRARADTVLAAMVDAGYLEETKAGQLLTPLPPKPMKAPTGQTIRYFSDWIVDGLEDLIGTPSEDIIVETTFNSKIQKIATKAVGETIFEFGEEKNFSQAAVIVMRPDGAVVAMVGGKDYGQSQFNRITQARRQPGSSFKPFVYLTALENGYRPDTLVIDEPITKGKYRPKNFGHKYYGELTLENALWLSLNTVSFGITQTVGPQTVADTARRMGIYSPMMATESIALGTSEVSPLELASAYSAIANGGYAVYPYAITKITSEEEGGKLYYQRPSRKKTRRVADYNTVQTLAGMMTGVLQNGTGQAAKLPYPAAGKTGTSQDSRDAWFMGFTDELVAGVWVGNDDNSPMKNVTGGSYPARIWQSVMAQSRRSYSPVNDMRFEVSGFQGLMDRLLPTRGALDNGAPPVIFWDTNPRSNDQRIRGADDEYAHERQGNYNE